MLERRFYKPCELVKMGINKDKLREFRERPDFPKPVFGKSYDIIAVKAYFDKLSGVKNDEDHDAIILERLHGKGADKVSSH